MIGMKIITLIIYKMYAELIGNYQKYRIKSLYDNILLMAELADEELTGIVPRLVEDEVSTQWQDIGYYKDERGITRFGIIPNKQQNIPEHTWKHEHFDSSRNHVSNPKYYWGT